MLGGSSRSVAISAHVWVLPILARAMASTARPDPLTLPPAELAAYRSALLDRFGNARVRHRLAQIAADGSSKLGVRVLPVLRAERSAGRLPTGCATALAGWVLHLRGIGVPVRDAGADRARAAAAAEDLATAVTGVLDTLSPGLGSDTALVDAVTAQAYAIRA